jgi:hypothetical protein
MKSHFDAHTLRKSILAFTVAIGVGFLLINLLGIYLVGPYGWDDGAITLAYAKTLSEHKVVALTGASEIVEGSSSLLYVFLIALLHKFIGFDFTGFILASQILAFSAVCATLVSVFMSLKSSIKNPLYQSLIIVLLGTLPMFTTEIFNGMEMSLFAFLLFLLTISYEAKSRSIFFLVPFVLLVRPESIFYLFFAFTFLLFFNKNQRLRIFSLGIYIALIFGLMTSLRWIYFNDFLPNTLWAKMNPPYSPVGTSRFFKTDGITEFLEVNFFLLIGVFSFLILQKKLDFLLDFKFWLIVSFAVFALLTGKNWGYQGRMFLACLPLLLLIMANNFSTQTGHPGNLMINCSNHKIQIDRQTLDRSFLVICLLGVHLSNFPLHISNFKTAMEGGYYQERLPNPLKMIIEKRRLNAGSDSYWYGITPENYRITGVAVERIRTLLDLDTITFMVPDVGGVGLCCERIRVIDSALLTNSFLAKKGYQKFDLYLSKVVPDIIETHGCWSEVTGIYQSSFFQNNYLPVVFNNNLFWIHRLQAEKLLQSPFIKKSLIENLSLLSMVRYSGSQISGSQIDREYISNQYVGPVWNIEPSPF